MNFHRLLFSAVLIVGSPYSAAEIASHRVAFMPFGNNYAQSFTVSNRTQQTASISIRWYLNGTTIMTPVSSMAAANSVTSVASELVAAAQSIGLSDGYSAFEVVLTTPDESAPVDLQNNSSIDAIYYTKSDNDRYPVLNSETGQVIDGKLRFSVSFMPFSNQYAQSISIANWTQSDATIDAAFYVNGTVVNTTNLATASKSQNTNITAAVKAAATQAGVIGQNASFDLLVHSNIEDGFELNALYYHINDQDRVPLSVRASNLSSESADAPTMPSEGKVLIIRGAPVHFRTTSDSPNQDEPLNYPDYSYSQTWLEESGSDYVLVRDFANGAIRKDYLDQVTGDKHTTKEEFWENGTLTYAATTSFSPAIPAGDDLSKGNSWVTRSTARKLEDWGGDGSIDKISEFPVNEVIRVDDVIELTLAGESTPRTCSVLSNSGPATYTAEVSDGHTTYCEGLGNIGYSGQNIQYVSVWSDPGDDGITAQESYSARSWHEELVEIRETKITDWEDYLGN